MLGMSLFGPDPYVLLMCSFSSNFYKMDSAQPRINNLRGPFVCSLCAGTASLKVSEAEVHGCFVAADFPLLFAAVETKVPESPPL